LLFDEEYQASIFYGNSLLISPSSIDPSTLLDFFNHSAHFDRAKNRVDSLQLSLFVAPPTLLSPSYLPPTRQETHTDAPRPALILISRRTSLYHNLPRSNVHSVLSNPTARCHVKTPLSHLRWNFESRSLASNRHHFPRHTCYVSIQHLRANGQPTNNRPRGNKSPAERQQFRANGQPQNIPAERQ